MLLVVLTTATHRHGQPEPAPSAHPRRHGAARAATQAAPQGCPTRASSGTHARNPNPTARRPHPPRNPRPTSIRVCARRGTATNTRDDFRPPSLASAPPDLAAVRPTRPHQSTAHASPGTLLCKVPCAAGGVRHGSAAKREPARTPPAAIGPHRQGVVLTSTNVEGAAEPPLNRASPTLTRANKERERPRGARKRARYFAARKISMASLSSFTPSA
jgi:hypothetical protein